MQHQLLGSTIALVVTAAAWMLTSFLTVDQGAARAQTTTPLAPAAPRESTYGGCPTGILAFHRCALEKAKSFTPPRTPDGQPDLQGYWRGRETYGNYSIEPVTADEPLTRDPIMPWRISAGMVVDPPDRMLPYQPWAAMIGRKGVNFKQYIDPRTACGGPSVPRALTDRTLVLQPPGEEVVTFLFEDQMTYRIVPTDGRPHIGTNIKLTMGDSVGRWEGNTLVVEVANLNGFNWFDDAGNFYTDTAVVTERLTMIDPNTIHATATIDDPKAYAKSWTMAWPMVRETTPGFEFLEEACREGERLVPMLRKFGRKFYRGDNLPWKRPD